MPAVTRRVHRQEPQAPAKAAGGPHKWLTVCAVAVVFVAVGWGLGTGVGPRASAASQEEIARRRARVAAEAAVGAVGRFAESPAREFKIQADPARVGLVRRPDEGGFLLQAQSDIPANASVARMPFSSTLDAVEAARILPAVARTVTGAVAETLLKLVAPDLIAAGEKGTIGKDELVALRDRELGRLQVLFTLVALRRNAFSDPALAIGDGDFAALRRLRLWVDASVPTSPFDNELSLLPEVAGRCLDKADKKAWEAAVASAAKDRAAIGEIVGAASVASGDAASIRTVLNFTNRFDTNVALDDVAWAVSVLRTRGYPRPGPWHVALVPVFDLNDQRTFDGWRVAVKPSRPVNAAVHFDDNASVVHVASVAPIAKDAFIVHRGDDDGSAPMSAAFSRRWYGFADRTADVVPSHAEALFKDVDSFPNAAAEGCLRPALLYFNATTGAPSPTLRRCVAGLIRADEADARVARFLGHHAKRAASVIYPDEAMFACRSLEKKRDPGSLAVQQASGLLAVFDATRAALLRVAALLMPSGAA